MACILLLAFTTEYLSQKRLAADYFLINTSGRQRMLTQQLAVLKIGPTVPVDSSSIKHSLEELEKIHQQILGSRFLQTDHGEMHEIYRGRDGINSQLANFTKLLESNNPDPARIFELSQRLLKLFEHSTQIIQNKARDDLTLSRTHQLFILVIAFLILSLELFFIFIPTIRHTSDQFVAMNNAAEKSFEAARLSALGELSSSIAHEIGGPMAVVQMSLELLSHKLVLGRPIDQSLLKLHENMTRQSQRIVHLLDSVRLHSRSAEKDPMVLVLSEKLIASSIEVLQGKIRQLAIDIDISHVDTKQTVYCRPSAIIQILTNLISNAVDAVESLPSSERKIIISSQVLKSGNIIQVSDSGQGVDPAIAHQIFESFFTTKPEGKGTGLGLPISQKIARDHNGYLKLNSSIRNSCFELFIPHHQKLVESSRLTVPQQNLDI